MFTLLRLLTIVKDKDELEDTPGAVCRIKCSDCQATYIDETHRNLTMWLNEHKQATKKGDLNSNIAEHYLKTSHTMGLPCELPTVPTTIKELDSRAGLL